MPFFCDAQFLCKRNMHKGDRNDMKNYEFWFIVGSQCLYGPEVLATVDARAKEMAETLS